MFLDEQVVKQGEDKSKKTKDSAKGVEKEIDGRTTGEEKRAGEWRSGEKGPGREKGKTNKLTSESLVYCWVGTR